MYIVKQHIIIYIWDKTKEKQQESFTRLFDEVEMLRKAVYDAGSILSIAYDEINK